MDSNSKRKEDALNKELLIKQFENGVIGADVMKFLGPVFDEFELSCFRRFKKLNPKVDNDAASLLSLEMEVVEKLRAEIFNAIQIGKEAEESLQEALD